jgi:hypothetical protein
MSRRSTIVNGQFLLDQFSGAAAAYSLRRLRNAYTGSCIRVRRSSDNAELDIGFTSTGVLDTVALLAHVGAGDGFVTTIYDQSGNARNFTQTSGGNQPRIVLAGVVDTKNGNPCIVASGSQYMSVPSSTGLFNFLHNGTASSVFAVASFGTVADPNAAYVLFGNDGGASANVGCSFIYDDRASVPRNNTIVQGITRGVLGNFTASSVSQNVLLPIDQTILSMRYAGAAAAADRVIAWINGGSAIANNTLTNAASGANATFNMQLFAAGNNAAPLVGTFQELIFYPSQPSQTGVRDNLRARYGTY